MLIFAHIHTACQDIHNTANCKRWAAVGECNKNPTWMEVNCPRSCLVCGKLATLADLRKWTAKPSWDVFLRTTINIKHEYITPTSMPAFCFSFLFNRLSQQEHKVFPVGQESFLQWQPICCLDGEKLQEELQQMLRLNSECLAVLIF